ncbi:MAG: dihydrodipicolinate reductase, partial [Desulfobacteraceae bacterium]|nr:dihydrodipicolinate reductase [Desulfobacteraceae bacterium]
DGSSLFEIKHNINGRDIYVSGTFDAVLFLSKKILLKENKNNLFTMIDVLNQD